MESWGFTYKTVAFTWIKINKDGLPFVGLGHHTRGNAELVLLGVRGKGVSRVDRGVSQIVMEQRGKHSQKPEVVQDKIERLYGPDVSKVELFARRERPGWVCWGDELDNGVELFGGDDD
jgi:site-specific DNA-methyltransferase (adenine-specific)